MANKPGEIRQAPHCIRSSELFETCRWVTPPREYRYWALSRVNTNRAKAARLATSLGNRVIPPTQGYFIGRFPTISERAGGQAAVVVDTITGRFHVRYPALRFKSSTFSVKLTPPMGTLEQALAFMTMVPDAPGRGGE